MNTMCSTLEDDCIKVINNYVLKIVHNLANFDMSDPSIIDALSRMNSYFVNNMHPFLIDRLVERFAPFCLNDNEKLMLLEICMNENMIRFNPQFRVTSPNCAYFYETKIAQLRNIVVLNLKMVATDGLLKVVGENCPNVETIDIVSRIGTFQYRFKINALRLEFHVSDEGLQYLHNCKKLRKVVMRKTVGNNCGGKRITYEGLKDLILALPNLRYLRYNNMGYVLDCVQFPEGATTFPDGRMYLNLNHLHDDHTDVEHIEKYAQFCPKLKSMCLHLTHFWDNETNSVISGQCLETLANSHLKLSALSLRGFSEHEHFTRFCQLKGEYLCYLKLHCAVSLWFKSYLIIGKFCPNLRRLEVANTTHACPKYFDDYSPYNGKYFQKLETLLILGVGCVNLCMNVLLRLISVNSLPQLTTFVCYGFHINVDTLDKFLIKSRNLQKVSISNGTQDVLLSELKQRHKLTYKIISCIPDQACHCNDIV